MARIKVTLDRRVSKRQTLTAKQLRSFVNYNPKTGIFTWRERSPSSLKMYSGGWNKKFAGKVCGTMLANGYIGMTIENRRYLAHRLAWLYVKGRWPKKIIDHKNRKRSDNRIANLAEATNRENLFNAVLSRRNTSGYRGVRFHKASGYWHARISHDGHEISLGYHSNKVHANIAYQTAARLIYGNWREVAARNGKAAPRIELS